MGAVAEGRNCPQRSGAVGIVDSHIGPTADRGSRRPGSRLDATMASIAEEPGSGDPARLTLTLPAQVPLATSEPPAGRAWARALARHGSWWWVPLVISVLFTSSVAIWLEHSDESDLE